MPTPEGGGMAGDTDTALQYSSKTSSCSISLTDQESVDTFYLSKSFQNSLSCDRHLQILVRRPMGTLKESYQFSNSEYYLLLNMGFCGSKSVSLYPLGQLIKNVLDEN